MELLTRNNFEGWMQKLMERLDRQDELLLAMKAEGKQPTITESIRLFDNQDLCMLLQISKRTLQRYRSVGALPYKTLGKKTYYSEEDVLTFLSNHIKDFKKEDIAFYKMCIRDSVPRPAEDGNFPERRTAISSLCAYPAPQRLSARLPS